MEILLPLVWVLGECEWYEDISVVVVVVAVVVNLRFAGMITQGKWG